MSDILKKLTKEMQKVQDPKRDNRENHIFDQMYNLHDQGDSYLQFRNNL